MYISPSLCLTTFQIQTKLYLVSEVKSWMLHMIKLWTRKVRGFGIPHQSPVTSWYFPQQWRTWMKKVATVPAHVLGLLYSHGFISKCYGISISFIYSIATFSIFLKFLFMIIYENYETWRKHVGHMLMSLNLWL